MPGTRIDIVQVGANTILLADGAAYVFVLTGC